MVRKLLIIFAASLIAVSCGSSEKAHSATSYTPAGSNELVTRTVSVRSFTGLSAANAVKVEYTCAGVSRPEVTVQAPADVIDYLKLKVENGILRIYYDFGIQSFSITSDPSRPRSNTSGVPYFNVAGTLVKIKGPALSSIKLMASAAVALTGNMAVKGDFSVDASSSGRLTCDGLISSTGKMSFNLSSSASVRGGDLRSQSSLIICSSSADLRWSGTWKNGGGSDFKLSSSGKVRGNAFESGPTGFNISSSARCELQSAILGDVDAYASSDGELLLAGRCGKAVMHASSAAKVEAYALRATKAEASASSGARINAPTTGYLSFQQSSGGKVSWQGTPRVSQL